MSMLSTWHGRPPMRPQCDCGCDPCRCDCGPPWSQDAIDCWNQMSQFKQMISQILQDPSLKIPIRGVTDGSDAKPGEVGEFLTTTLTGTFPATALSQVLNGLVLPPGDWDTTVFIYVTWPTVGAQVVITSVNLYLKNPPAGLSGDMGVIWEASELGVSSAISSITLTSQPTRANVTVPTLLSFTLDTQEIVIAERTSAAYTIINTARRMR